MQYGDCYMGAYFETIFDLLFLASQPLSFLSFPALYRLLFVSSLSQAMAPLAYCLALVLGCCKSEEDSNHGLHSTNYAFNSMLPHSTAISQIGTNPTGHLNDPTEEVTNTGLQDSFLHMKAVYITWV